MADKKISALSTAVTPLAGTEVLPVVQSGSTVQVSVSDLTAGRTVALRNANLTGGAAIINIGATGDTTYHYTRYIDNANQSFYTGVDDSTGGFFGAGAFGRVLYSEGAKPLKVFVNGAYRAEYDTSGNYKLDTGNLVIGTAGKGIDFSANANAPGMTSELLTWYEEGVFTPTVFGTGTAGTGTYTFQVGRYVRIGKVVQFQASLAWSAHTGTGNFGGVGGLPFSSISTADNYSIPSIYVSDLALTALNTIQGFIGPSTSTIALRQVPVGGGTSSVIPFDTNVSALIITGSYIAA